MSQNSRNAVLGAIMALSLQFLFSGPGSAQVVVTQITHENAPQLLVTCPDRHGGIGDWYLANDRIWAIFDGVSNLNQISASGGTLIDLGPVRQGRRQGEQFIQLMQLINMTRDLIIPYDGVRVEKGDDWAAVIFSAHGLRPERSGFGVLGEEAAQDIVVETEYRLVAGENFLRLKSTVRNEGEKRARIFNFCDVLFWGDDAMKPFAGAERRLGRCRGAPRGFHHPALNPDSIFSIVRGIGGYSYVAGGGVEGLSPVSYGLCSPIEYRKNKLLWGVNDRLISGVGIFTGGFTRPLSLWKIFFFGLPPGRHLVYERVLIVGRRNDVASVTDTIFCLLGKTDKDTGVVGKLMPPGADSSVIICAEQDEIPVTQIRPDREGETAGLVRALLPPGNYLAKIRSVERDADANTPQVEPLIRRFTVEKGRFTDLGSVELPGVSTLLVEVYEGEKRSPARVIIRGASGTADPELGTDLLGFTIDDRPTPSTYRANWILLDGNETGPVRVDLRPGRYSLYATRGFEYSVDQAEVVLNPSGAVAVKLSIERVIDTPGMMSGDFHVHSASSADSAFPQEKRVISLVAEGVDLVIATDHDVLTDYAPVIEKLNLQDQLTSMVGVESTSMLRLRATPFTIGHYNAWPLKYDSLQPRCGMIVDEGMRPRDLYVRLREIGDGECLIQVNHGRGGTLGGEASYFKALGLDFGAPLAYDPSRPLTESPNNLLLAENSNGVRDIDFDAMELINGPFSYHSYLQLREDWFSLLNQGYLKTATSNSDCHRKADLPGYHRNYILLEDPSAERADHRELVERARRQKVFGTSGPIIFFTINGEADLGDMLMDTDGVVNLDVKVLAPTWVPIDEVRIFANGQQVELLEAGPASQVIRLERSISVPIERDTWFVVEASTSYPGDSQPPSQPGGLYNIIAPGLVPLAFTNPIYVDADGDGTFDPPGKGSPSGHL